MELLLEVQDGYTLGQKHRRYNRLVVEALKSNEPLKPIDYSASDIQNLLNIDVACKKRDVNYILKVLKSEDQLYVSKAIKRSTWLFTESQYAHIINPKHLFTKMYPEMTLKAFNKLMLNIRLNLKDETRVEAFYNYIKKKNVNTAYKWLQNCPLATVIKEVANKENVCQKRLRRLVKKSFSVYASFYNDYFYFSPDEHMFIVTLYSDKLLEVLENTESNFHYYRFDPKRTKFLMKTHPDRVIKKFNVYAKYLHIATFAKFLKENQDIEEFLLAHAGNENLTWLYAFDKIQHFIKHMPVESRFIFIKKVFIDIELNNAEDKQKYQTIIDSTANQFNKHGERVYTEIYKWYNFFPFEFAYAELKKLIRAESTPLIRSRMLQVLLSSAGRNKDHIHEILQYYHDNHINEPFKYKNIFLKYLIKNVDTHTLEVKSWNILVNLFQSMEVFTDSKNNVQPYIKAIIVRNAIHKEQVPDIIAINFDFDTLKSIQNKLTKEEKETVFEYLRDDLIEYFDSLNLTTESEFITAVSLCEMLLKLLNDWGQELSEHKYALDIIKELVQSKKQHQWNHDLTPLYNTKKKWRKNMFELFFDISPTENACINALKHDPGMLHRNYNQVVEMYRNTKVSLRNLFRKIRIYWPDTLAKDFKNKLLQILRYQSEHKNLIIGLCTLLHGEQVNDLLKDYAPSTITFNQDETDQVMLSLRQPMAKNVHKCRPPPSMNNILSYSKGDYLIYAAPSIEAILNQMSPNKCRLYISIILLDAPISLQKIGLRCAIHKIPFEELNQLLSNTWNSTKKSSIRKVIFKQTFKLLYKNSSTHDIKDIWLITSMLIDKLTSKDKHIYKALDNVYKVADSIKSEFYMKMYTFFNSLPSHCSKRPMNELQYFTKLVKKSLNENFIINILLKDLNNIFTNENRTKEIISVIPSFILSSEDETTQIMRYEKSLEIILELYLPKWESNSKEKSNIKQHLQTILIKLVKEMKTNTYERKFQIPAIVFEKILLKLEQNLSYHNNYIVLTTWKLVATYVKLLNENKYVLNDFKIETDTNLAKEEENKMYTTLHENLAPLFASNCTEHLKKDMMCFGKSIFSLFAIAVKLFFHNYLTEAVCQTKHRLLYQKCMLLNGKEKELYLMVQGTFVEKVNDYRCSKNEVKKIYKDIYDLVMLDASDDIKMHFYHTFRPILLDTKQTS